MAEKRNILMRIVKWFVITLVVLYIGMHLARIDWKEFWANRGSYELGNLAIAFLVFLVGLFYLGFGWHIILWKMGGSLPFRRGIYIWVTSQFMRFVPGKVVLVLGRAFMCEKEGIKKRMTSASVIYEMAFLNLAAFLLFAVATKLGPPPLRGDIENPLLRITTDFLLIVREYWFLGFLGILVVHPKLFYALINWLLHRIGREPLSKDLRFVDSLLILLYYVGFWFVTGTGCYFVLRSVLPNTPWSALLATVGIYSFACTAGFLAFIFPSGLGVQESSLNNTLLATGLMVGENHPFLVVLGARIISLLAEAVGFLAVRTFADTRRYEDIPSAERVEPVEAGE